MSLEHWGHEASMSQEHRGHEASMSLEHWGHEANAIIWLKCYVCMSMTQVMCHRWQMSEAVNELLMKSEAVNGT